MKQAQELIVTWDKRKEIINEVLKLIETKLYDEYGVETTARYTRRLLMDAIDTVEDICLDIPLNLEIKQK
jgi:hypothetical protein